MHLLNGYLRKLLVRYIGALLTRLPVALNWEPKPACAPQITCPMAFLGILYDSACALHTPCSCSETGSHPHPAQASWERCRAVAHREDHPVRAGGLGEPRLAPDVRPHRLPHFRGAQVSSQHALHCILLCHATLFINAARQAQGHATLAHERQCQTETLGLFRSAGARPCKNASRCTL